MCGVHLLGVCGHAFPRCDASCRRATLTMNVTGAKWPAHISRKPVYDPNYIWSGTDYMGSSLKAITEVADQKGYELVGTSITGANAFYVIKNLINDKFSKNKEITDLYNPPRYWLIYDHFWHIGHPADFGPYTDA